MFSLKIVSETFLEDINNILNSGEVPNLFDKDEFEQVLGGVRAIAKDHGVDDTDRDGVIRLFKTRFTSFMFITFKTTL